MSLWYDTKYFRCAFFDKSFFMSNSAVRSPKIRKLEHIAVLPRKLSHFLRKFKPKYARSLYFDRFEEIFKKTFCTQNFNNNAIFSTCHPKEGHNEIFRRYLALLFMFNEELNWTFIFDVDFPIRTKVKCCWIKE